MNALKRVGQTVLFAAVERLIAAEARRFARCQRIVDLDDLLSEGQYQFLICYDTYDESKGVRFDTWFRRRLVYSFCDLLRRERRRRTEVSVDLDAIPVEIVWAAGRPDGVTGDAAVVFAAFDRLRLTGDQNTPAKAAAALRKAVRRVLGSRKRTERAWAAAESIIQGGAA